MPRCGAMSQARMWSGINAEVNPNLRLSVLEESLFDWTCPHCGYQAMLAYPCLYHDKSRRFMIYILPGEPDPKKAAGISAQFPQLRGVRKRVTGSLATLKEKILLFEDGLDDRAAELVKLLLALVLANSTGKRVEQGFYCTCDEEKDRIGFSFFVEGEEGAGAPHDLFCRIPAGACHRGIHTSARRRRFPSRQRNLCARSAVPLSPRRRNARARPAAGRAAGPGGARSANHPRRSRKRSRRQLRPPNRNRPNRSSPRRRNRRKHPRQRLPSQRMKPSRSLSPRTEQILGPAADPVAKPVAEWVAKPVAETIAEAIDEPEDTQETPVDFSILETPTGEEPPENKMGE